MTFGIREALSVLSVVVCGLAILKGNAPERWSGLFIASAWGAVVANQFLTRTGAPSVGVVSAVGLTADIGLACGFLWLALRFSNLWLAAALMLQSIQLALYGSFLAHGATHSHNSYAVASNIESGLLLLVILAATLWSWRSRVVARRDGSVIATPQPA